MSTDKNRRRVFSSSGGSGEVLSLRIIDYNVRIYSGEIDITDKFSLLGIPWHIGADSDGNIYLVESDNSSNMCYFNKYSISDYSRTILYSSSSLDSFTSRVPSIFSTSYDVIVRNGNSAGISANTLEIINLGNSGSVYVQQVYKSRYLITDETYKYGSSYYELNVIDTYDLSRSSHTLNLTGDAWPYCVVLPQIGNSNTIVIAYYLDYSSTSFFIATYTGDFTDHVVSGNVTHLPTSEFNVNINYKFGESYYSCTPQSAYVDDTGIYLYVKCTTEGDYGYNYYYEYLRYNGGSLTRMASKSSIGIGGMICNDGTNSYVFESSYGSSPNSRSYVSTYPMGSSMSFSLMSGYSLLGLQASVPK